MKYIVLSFDDGFTDFKENALPILEKYNFKASINIVSGYSDKSISSEFDCLSVSDIQALQNEGHEIANHSDSHLNKTNSDDFEKCNQKLKSWLGCNTFGAVIPYSQRVDKELFQYFLDNRYLYITDYSHHTVKRSVPLFFARVLNKIFKSKTDIFLVSRQYYVYNSQSIRGCSLPFFSRLPINRQTTPKELIKFIKYMGNGNCLTIVFHSIVKNLDDKVDWPEGAWTIDEFDSLLNYLHKDKSVTVLTQKQLIQNIKNEN